MNIPRLSWDSLPREERTALQALGIGRSDYGRIMRQDRARSRPPSFGEPLDLDSHKVEAAAQFASLTPEEQAIFSRFERGMAPGLPDRRKQYGLETFSAYKAAMDAGLVKILENERSC